MTEEGAKGIVLFTMLLALVMAFVSAGPRSIGAAIVFAVLVWEGRQR